MLESSLGQRSGGWDGWGLTAKGLGIASLFEQQITEKQRFPWTQDRTMALGGLEGFLGRVPGGTLMSGRMSRGRGGCSEPFWLWLDHPPVVPFPCYWGWQTQFVTHISLDLSNVSRQAGARHSRAF